MGFQADRFERVHTYIHRNNPSVFSLKFPPQVQEQNPILRCSEHKRDLLNQYLHKKHVKLQRADWDKRVLHFQNMKLYSLKLKLKNACAALGHSELDRRKKAANPYENLRKSFTSRCANKLASLDKKLNFELTLSENPSSWKDSNSKEHAMGSVFYVADIGCSSGSYSEYVVRRKGFYNCKSFGINIHNDMTYIPENLRNSWPFFLEIDHSNGYGDINDMRVRQNFVRLVKKGTSGSFAKLCLADVVNWHPLEICHEFYFMKLLVTQILLSLKVLSSGGNLVVTFFEMNTLMSAGLFYLLYYCFHRVCIQKPDVSRPSSPERFVVCLDFSQRLGLKVIHHLEFVLSKWSGDGRTEVVECVPFSIIHNDESFSNYLLASNFRILTKQVEFLEHIVSNRTCANVEKHSKRLRLEMDLPGCANYMTFRGFEEPEKFFEEFLLKIVDDSHRRSVDPNMFFQNLNTLTPNIVCSTIKGVFMHCENAWKRMPNLCIPPFTVLLVECSHPQEDSRGNMRPSFRIIDCGVLHGNFVFDWEIHVRHLACMKFMEAITPASEEFLYYDSQKCLLMPDYLTQSRLFTSTEKANLANRNPKLTPYTIGIPYYCTFFGVYNIFKLKKIHIVRHRSDLTKG